MGLRWKTQCGDQHPEKRFQVEKYKTVAIHASRMVRKLTRATMHEMEA